MLTPDLKELSIRELSKRCFCQQGRQIAEGGTGLKTVFVSVCGNLQHI
jgi:hypothetical protein